MGNFTYISVHLKIYTILFVIFCTYQQVMCRCVRVGDAKQYHAWVTASIKRCSEFYEILRAEDKTIIPWVIVRPVQNFM